MVTGKLIRCQHIKANGAQCGSPSLRRRHYCYFHEGMHNERQRIIEQFEQDKSAERTFDVPILEDGNSIQIALMKIIQLLGAGRIDRKSATVMIYALQTAVSNLKNVNFAVSHPDKDLVVHCRESNGRCIGGPQWFSWTSDEEEADDLITPNPPAVAQGAKPVARNTSAESKSKENMVREKAINEPVTARVTAKEARDVAAKLTRSFLLQAGGIESLTKLQE
jgi:hypothetical protein